MTLTRVRKYAKASWQTVITVIATAAAIVIPLHLVFRNEVPGDFLGWEAFLTLLFSADAVVHQVFLRRINDKSQPHFRQIPPEYRPFWLSADLLAALPFFWMGSSPFWLTLRCLKLLRVGQTMRQWRLGALKFSDALKLAFFVYWFFLVSHWLTCGWLVLASDLIRGDPLTRYLAAFHWVIETLTSVGFGETIPVTNAQRVYSIVIMLAGVGVYGYVIGHIAGILAKRDPVKNQYLSHLEQLSAFVRYREIPPGLQKRIRDYYAYIWKKRLGFDETTFLSGLPRGLASEVSLHLKREILEKIPLFKNVDSRFVEEVALNLKPDVYTPGEFIFKEGRPARRMYLIVKGRVEVLRKGGTVVNTLGDGDFFGEIALFSDQTRTAGVRAVTYCDLYILEKEVFQYLLEQFPDIGRQLQETARQRLDQDERKNQEG